jgi:hypothetical protein
MTDQPFNEKDLLDLGFEKEYFGNENEEYFLFYEFFPSNVYIDLQLLWEEGWDYCNLFPYDKKVEGMENVTKLIEAFKIIA